MSLTTLPSLVCRAPFLFTLFPLHPCAYLMDPPRKRRRLSPPPRRLFENPRRLAPPRLFDCFDIGTNLMIAAFLRHPIEAGESWSASNHFSMCGQSCPCCRFNAGDYLGACPFCPDSAALRAASKPAARWTSTFLAFGLVLGAPFHSLSPCQTAPSTVG